MVSKSELEKLLDEFLEDKICNRTPEELGKDVLSLDKKNLLLLLTKSLCVIEKQMDDIASVQHLAKHYNSQLVNKTIERNASSMMSMKDFQERTAKEKRDKFTPVREKGLKQKIKNAKEKKAQVLQMNDNLLKQPASEGWGSKKKRADHIAQRTSYSHSYICRLIAKPRKSDQN